MMMSAVFHNRRDDVRHKGQDGMTLVEIMVALAILALIVGPFVLAMTTVLRSNATSAQTLDRASEAQRVGEAWTHDVQTVAHDGVNDPDVGPCGTAEASEVHLITFNWDRSLDASDRAKKSTWLTRGSGQNMSLIRRSCDGFEVTEQVLAADIGVAGRTVRQTVNGGSAADPFNFCPVGDYGIGWECSLVVDGATNYSLTVRRRVPDIRHATVNQVVPNPVTVMIGHPRFKAAVVDWSEPIRGTGQVLPVTEYQVFLYSDPDGTVPAASPQSAPGDELLRTIFTGLTNDTQYFVRIKARNAVGWGDYSQVYGPIVPTVVSPDSPSNVSAVADISSATVDVTWTPAPVLTGAAPRTGYSIWAYKVDDETAASGIPYDKLVGPMVVTFPTPTTSTTPITAKFTQPLDEYVRYRFIVSDTNEKGSSWDPVAAQAGPTANFPSISNAVSTYHPTVFVSTDGGSSADCAIETPCNSIATALSKGNTKSGWASFRIAIAAGTYDRLSLSGSQVTKPVTLLGGFATDFGGPANVAQNVVTFKGAQQASGVWNAGSISGLASKSNSVTISGVTFDAGEDGTAGANRTSTGLVISGSNTKAVLQGVTVLGGSGQHPTGLLVSEAAETSVVSSSINSGTVYTTGGANPGHSAYGVRALSGAKVTVATSDISAENGADGKAGSAGAAGAGGCGSSGQTASTCTSGNPKGGNGGNGTNGWGQAGGAGASGEQGGAATVAGGGPGGAKGPGGTGLGGESGKGGTAGTNGGGGQAPAMPAPASSSDLSSQGDVWSGTVQSDGLPGPDGGGGGGGGGGSNGRKAFWGSRLDGGAGGSGGAAGMGGRGGTAGSAGGGSFGIFASGSGTTLSVTTSTIITSNGGTGGAGGKGGDGGGGANGAAGVAGENGAAFSGGDGAKGGAGGGGAGGNGGNGGEGGPSIGVFTTSGATRGSTSGTVPVVGTKGAGGIKGGKGSKGTSAGNAGADGRDGNPGADSVSLPFYPT